MSNLEIHNETTVIIPYLGFSQTSGSSFNYLVFSPRKSGLLIFFMKQLYSKKTSYNKHNNSILSYSSCLACFVYYARLNSVTVK